MSLKNRLAAGGFGHLIGLATSPKAANPSRRARADGGGDDNPPTQDDLDAREKALDDREEDLAAREKALDDREDDVSAREQALDEGEDDEERDSGKGDVGADDEDDDTGARADDDQPTPEEDEQMKKAAKAGHRGAIAVARKLGRKAERKRCRRIFESPHAAGRVPLACNLAFKTSMPASAAVEALKTSPKAGGLAGRMDASGGRTRVPPDQPQVSGKEAIAKAWEHSMSKFGPKQR